MKRINRVLEPNKGKKQKFGNTSREKENFIKRQRGRQSNDLVI